MIFSRKHNYLAYLYFLIRDFNYAIKKEESLSTMSLNYYFSKEDSPDLLAEIERGYLNIYVLFGDKKYTLPEIYKYLHHDKIPICANKTNKELDLLFEKTMNKYLSEYLSHRANISVENLESFYKEFPRNTFAWG